MQTRDFALIQGDHRIQKDKLGPQNMSHHLVSSGASYIDAYIDAYRFRTDMMPTLMAEAFEEMLNDPYQIPSRDTSDPEWQKKYLSSHIEIDAHAHDAAEELLAIYNEDQIKDILSGKVDLSDRKLPNAILHYYEILGGSHEATHKFMSKLYTQVERMKKNTWNHF